MPDDVRAQIGNLVQQLEAASRNLAEYRNPTGAANEERLDPQDVGGVTSWSVRPTPDLVNRATAEHSDAWRLGEVQLAQKVLDLTDQLDQLRSQADPNVAGEVNALIQGARQQVSLGEDAHHDAEDVRWNMQRAAGAEPEPLGISHTPGATDVRSVIHDETGAAFMREAVHGSAQTLADELGSAFVRGASGADDTDDVASAAQQPHAEDAEDTGPPPVQ